jgi:DNA-binding MarR family transcriptional regulator
MGMCDDHAVRPPDLEGVDELSLRAYEEWAQTLHVQRQLALRLMPDKDMHPGQARCIWAISTNDGITQRDLAELLHVSRPTVTAMLQRLERSGFVERSNDADDARLTRICLTPSGRELDGKLRAFHRDYINATIGSMSEADRSQFVRLLGVLRANIEQELHSKEAPAQ